MENKEQNGRYRVVITDTETGEVGMDAYFNVIIAGLQGNGNRANVSITHAHGVDICLGVVLAKKAIEETKEFLVSKTDIPEKMLDFTLKAAADFLESDGGEE